MPEVVPTLLGPYILNITQRSLICITSVLGATSNWLLIRYLHSILGNAGGRLRHDGDEGLQDAKVVLVSFLRGLDFWKADSRRLVGSLTLSAFAFFCGLIDFHWFVERLSGPPLRS